MRLVSAVVCFSSAGPLLCGAARPRRAAIGDVQALVLNDPAYAACGGPPSWIGSPAPLRYRTASRVPIDCLQAAGSSVLHFDTPIVPVFSGGDDVSNVSIHLGDNFTLALAPPCDEDVPCTVTWYAGHVAFDAHELSYTISNFRSRNAGWYFAEVFSQSQVAQSPLVRVTPAASAPIVESRQVTYTASDGSIAVPSPRALDGARLAYFLPVSSTVMVSYLVDGAPTPAVAWAVDDPATNNSSSTAVTTTSGFIGGVATATLALEQNASIVLSLAAQNTEGHAAAAVIIVPVSPPSIWATYASVLFVAEGADFNLSVSLFPSNAPTSVEWRRQGNETYGNATQQQAEADVTLVLSTAAGPPRPLLLALHNASDAMHGGEWAVAARNVAGAATLTLPRVWVVCPPLILNATVSAIVQSGGGTTLFVLVEGCGVRVSWWADGVLMSSPAASTELGDDHHVHTRLWRNGTACVTYSRFITRRLTVARAIANVTVLATNVAGSVSLQGAVSVPPPTWTLTCDAAIVYASPFPIVGCEGTAIARLGAVIRVNSAACTTTAMDTATLQLSTSTRGLPAECTVPFVAVATIDWAHVADYPECAGWSQGAAVLGALQFALAPLGMRAPKNTAGTEFSPVPLDNATLSSATHRSLCAVPFIVTAEIDYQTDSTRLALLSAARAACSGTFTLPPPTCVARLRDGSVPCSVGNEEADAVLRIAAPVGVIVGLIIAGGLSILATVATAAAVPSPTSEAASRFGMTKTLALLTGSSARSAIAAVSLWDLVIWLQAILLIDALPLVQHPAVDAVAFVALLRPVWWRGRDAYAAVMRAAFVSLHALIGERGVPFEQQVQVPAQPSSSQGCYANQIVGFQRVASQIGVVPLDAELHVAVWCVSGCIAVVVIAALWICVGHCAASRVIRRDRNLAIDAQSGATSVSNRRLQFTAVTPRRAAACCVARSALRIVTAVLPLSSLAAAYVVFQDRNSPFSTAFAVVWGALLILLALVPMLLHTCACTPLVVCAYIARGSRRARQRLTYRQQLQHGKCDGAQEMHSTAIDDECARSIPGCGIADSSLASLLLVMCIVLCAAAISSEAFPVAAAGAVLVLLLLITVVLLWAAHTRHSDVRLLSLGSLSTAAALLAALDIAFHQQAAVIAAPADASRRTATALVIVEVAMITVIAVGCTASVYGQCVRRAAATSKLLLSSSLSPPTALTALMASQQQQQLIGNSASPAAACGTAPGTAPSQVQAEPNSRSPPTVEAGASATSSMLAHAESSPRSPSATDISTILAQPETLGLNACFLGGEDGGDVVGAVVYWTMRVGLVAVVHYPQLPLLLLAPPPPPRRMPMNIIGEHHAAVRKLPLPQPPPPDEEAVVSRAELTIYPRTSGQSSNSDSSPTRDAASPLIPTPSAAAAIDIAEVHEPLATVVGDSTAQQQQPKRLALLRQPHLLSLELEAVNTLGASVEQMNGVDAARRSLTALEEADIERRRAGMNQRAFGSGAAVAVPARRDRGADGGRVGCAHIRRRPNPYAPHLSAVMPPGFFDFDGDNVERVPRAAHEEQQQSSGGGIDEVSAVAVPATAQRATTEGDAGDNETLTDVPLDATARSMFSPAHPRGYLARFAQYAQAQPQRSESPIEQGSAAVSPQAAPTAAVAGDAPQIASRRDMMVDFIMQSVNALTSALGGGGNNTNSSGSSGSINGSGALLSFTFRSPRGDGDSTPTLRTTNNPMHSMVPHSDRTTDDRNSMAPVPVSGSAGSPLTLDAWTIYSANKGPHYAFRRQVKAARASAATAIGGISAPVSRIPTPAYVSGMLQAAAAKKSSTSASSTHSG